MKRVSERLYQRQQDGAFFARILIRGRQTWRKLKAVKLRSAIAELAATDWETPAGTFAELADQYVKAHCPNRRLEPRDDEFTQPEARRVEKLKLFFGRQRAAELRLAHLPRYHSWRTAPRNLRQGNGDRTVDKELTTLSNVMNFGVAMGSLEFNFIGQNRPRYRREKDIRHSREVAPESAEVVHRLAGYFFDNLRSEVFGWQALFAAFTGCRTSELLRLRLDAKSEEAGWIEGNMLFLGRRSKSGVNPFALIWPEFAAMLPAFRRWHKDRYPQNPYFFPGPFGKAPVSLGAMGHALVRACAALRLPHITPHGFRSFYVTKRRGDGVSDVQIAGEIGDRTVTLMQSTYGGRPANWRGGSLLKWVPAKEAPAWNRWFA